MRREPPDFARRRSPCSGAPAVEFTHPRVAKVSASRAELFGKADVGNVPRGIAHLGRGPGVAEHRITGGEHTARVNRIPPFLKIKVAANAVNHNKIIVRRRVQVGDWPGQTQAVKAPLFPVGDYAFVVFEGAGEQGLAVAFHHRQIDHKINGQGSFA